MRGTDPAAVGLLAAELYRAHRRCGPSGPGAWFRLISRLIPGSELVMIEGGGHILFAERPTEYQKALGDWLRKTA